MDTNPLPQDGSAHGTEVPQQDAVTFGNVPHVAANDNNNVRQVAERTPDHVLTNRDVVRMFELEKIYISEKSIRNWCIPNKSGITRLDAFHDGNQRRYYITPQSVAKFLPKKKQINIDR
jgi:hypothetical protein